MSATRHSEAACPFAVVVVVGSQGGLRAFEEILWCITPGFPTGLVFDLHRSDRYGITAQVLARRSELPVRVASEGLAVEPATVYVAPADRQLLISADGVMRTSEAHAGTGHRSADPLLFSAAQAFGPGVIAVVLSGRLAGGAEGVREVKRRGGRVLVQDPQTAVAPSMHSAALATGCVDFSLPPLSLGQALVALCAAAGAADLFRVRLNAGVLS